MRRIVAAQIPEWMHQRLRAYAEQLRAESGSLEANTSDAMRLLIERGLREIESKKAA